MSEKNKPKIYIGIPRSGRWAHPKIEYQRLRLIFRLIKEDLLLWHEPDDYPVYEAIGTLPHIARNMIVANFLTRRQHKHDRLLMIDDDMVCPIGMGWRLLSRDAEVVAPLFFRRNQIEPCWYAFDGKLKLYGEEWPRPVPRYDLAERVAKAVATSIGTASGECMMAFGELPPLEPLDATGTGVVMIRGDVFDKLESPYFMTGVMGEDFWFSIKCAEKGIKVYGDISVCCGHWYEGGMGICAFRDHFPKLKSEMTNCVKCNNPLDMLSWPIGTHGGTYECENWSAHVPQKENMEILSE